MEESRRRRRRLRLADLDLIFFIFIGSCKIQVRGDNFDPNGLGKKRFLRGTLPESLLVFLEEEGGPMSGT